MDYIAHFDNVLDPIICKKIINLFEEKTNQQEHTLLENHRSFNEINITKNEGWKDIQGILLDKMQNYLGIYMKYFNIDAKSWPEKTGYEEFRIKKYMPNDFDEFQFHVDVQDYATAKRFLVFFFYLNTVKEGGETAFQKNKQSDFEMKVQPVEGRLLMFPPLWTHPHVALKPISEPKYIIGSYLHYI